MTTIERPEVLVPGWSAPANIVAFTTLRTGGCSGAPFDSFNLGLHVGDNRDSVLRNRSILQSQFALPSEPAWLQQTHSSRVVLLDAVPSAALAADGAISSVSGVVCAVMTADCMPLFLTNAGGTRVGLIHVGWRGLANGIIEQAIVAFRQPVEEVLAWAGPTISASHFEVGNEVRDQLGGPGEAYTDSPNPGKCFADLYHLAAKRLSKLGVTGFGHADSCTFADQAQFFSHRRDQQTGRMVSIIYRS